MFKMTIFGEPTSKLRHRIVRVKDKIRSYDPQEDKKNVTKMLMMVRKKHDGIDILEGPLAITFLFYCYPIKKGWIDKIWGLSPHTDKPDIDNMIKYYLDCANEVVFNDDKQIVSCTAKKYYSTMPRTEIIIEKIPLNEIDESDKKILYNFSPKLLSDFSRDCESITDFFKEVEDLAERGLESNEASIGAALLKTFSDKWLKILTKIGKL